MAHSLTMFIGAVDLFSEPAGIISIFVFVLSVAFHAGLVWSRIQTLEREMSELKKISEKVSQVPFIAQELAKLGEMMKDHFRETNGGRRRNHETEN